MATAGNVINYSNFSHTMLDSGLGTPTIYGSNHYWYIRSESFGFKCKVNSQFLGDWHGYIDIDYWNGSGWTACVRDMYMQDSGTKVWYSFRHNMRTDITQPTSDRVTNNSSTYNLWRIVAAYEKWGTQKGLSCQFFIGSPGTMTESQYNSYLKNASNPKIYSNGRVSQSTSSYLIAVLDGGSSGLSNSAVISAFGSNTGTLIYGSYERAIVGAIRY